MLEAEEPLAVEIGAASNVAYREIAEADRRAGMVAALGRQVGRRASFGEHEGEGDAVLRQPQLSRDAETQPLRAGRDAASLEVHLVRVVQAGRGGVYGEGYGPAILVLDARLLRCVAQDVLQGDEEAEGAAVVLGPRCRPPGVGGRVRHLLGPREGRPLGGLGTQERGVRAARELLLQGHRQEHLGSRGDGGRRHARAQHDRPAGVEVDAVAEDRGLVAEAVLELGEDRVAAVLEVAEPRRQVPAGDGAGRPDEVSVVRVRLLAAGHLVAVRKGHRPQARREGGVVGQHHGDGASRAHDCGGVLHLLRVHGVPRLAAEEQAHRLVRHPCARLRRSECERDLHEQVVARVEREGLRESVPEHPQVLVFGLPDLHDDDALLAVRHPVDGDGYATARRVLDRLRGGEHAPLQARAASLADLGPDPDGLLGLLLPLEGEPEAPGRLRPTRGEQRDQDHRDSDQSHHRSPQSGCPCLWGSYQRGRRESTVAAWTEGWDQCS